MRKSNLVFVTVIALIFSRTAFANRDCVGRTWKGKPSASLRTIKAKLDRMPRKSVVQLAWGEMLKADQSKSVALPMLQYLAGTEQHKTLRGYYKAMSAVLTKGQMPSEAIQRWPTRTPASKSRYSLPQLCQMYHQAGGS